MWVRGLKHISANNGDSEMLSHPMWVRGLKPIYILDRKHEICVAPYVGAWIETDNKGSLVNTIGRRTLCGCVD